MSRWIASSAHLPARPKEPAIGAGCGFAPLSHNRLTHLDDLKKMAATAQTNAITLKGSTEMVAEFFGKKQ